MTVQIIDVAGQKMAMLPMSEYEELIDLAEGQADRESAKTSETRRKNGEEYIPIEIVDRILAGESALKTWRNYRGITQAQLAGQVGYKMAYISKLENGHKMGGIDVWAKIAQALNVDLVDLLPA